MHKSLLTVVAFAMLTGCGTVAHPMAATIANSAMAIRSADPDKHAVNPPAPLPPRQGFTVSDAASIATQAYATAFAAKTPADAQEAAKLALSKIAALVPGTNLATQVVPFAQAMMACKLTDAENQRRAALWPLLYISRGLSSTQDPQFFDCAAQVMKSMVNFQDGLAVGMASLNFLSDSSNGYVKTMVEKAFAAYKDPKTNLKDSYNLTLETLKDIGTTLNAVKK